MADKSDIIINNMSNVSKTKLKPIPITDQEAIRLIRERAKREGRSMANAAAVTIKEALSQSKQDYNNKLS
ncbi:MAG: hypothetical protein KAT56_10600 [Sedimentisphaerales bacterium]|nr:hypothetical protein [Sedimentisphaerales bacterium]